MQVEIAEARNQLPQLIESALAGETVVIAHRGVPIVQMVPVDGAEKSPRRGSAEAILSCLDALGPAGVRRSSEELDAELHAERASWD
jgi:prevent-host-death family protein